MKHRSPFEERPRRPKEGAPPQGSTPAEAMRHKMDTTRGRELYRHRKMTVEPVFGIIKSVMGFRQFLLRGAEKAGGEWSLVATAWNLRRMFTLRGAKTVAAG